MKKIRMIMYYFFMALFIVFLINAILLATGKFDFVFFTFTSLSWFEPQSRMPIAILILEVGILSPVIALLIKPEEEDPVTS